MGASAALGASGCNDAPVAKEQTSLTDKPLADPGKPAKLLSMVWLHHGCAEALLAAGLKKALRDNNIDVVALRHGDGKVDAKLAPKGRPTANGHYVIGDHTRPGDLAAHFADDAIVSAIRRHGSASTPHRIVAFSSCHGVVRLRDEAALARVKRAYVALLPHLQRRQAVLFVALTMPPLTAAVSGATERKRARALARWLRDVWPGTTPNVRVFDLFDALAVRGAGKHAAGKLANALAPQFARSARDPRPTQKAAADAVARLLVPWLNQALKSRGL